MAFMRLMSPLLLAALLGAAFWPTAASADESAAQKLAERAFPKSKVKSIRALEKLGLYEVYINSTVIFIDKDARYIVAGVLFDGATLRNITQDSQEQLSRIDFSALPLQQAIKRVNGTGRRVIATFEDPNCGYCKQYMKELAALKDVTIYTFMYPIVAPDSPQKASAIWCAPDRAAAWHDWMNSGMLPVSPKAKCEAPNTDILKLGQQFDIKVTPTTYLQSGKRLNGYVPVKTLEAELKADRKK